MQQRHNIIEIMKASDSKQTIIIAVIKRRATQDHMNRMIRVQRLILIKKLLTASNADSFTVVTVVTIACNTIPYFTFKTITVNATKFIRGTTKTTHLCAQ